MRPGLLHGPLGRLAVAFLLVASTVGWRRGQYFSGSLDPVVVAKGGLSALALALAFYAAQTAGRRRLGTGSMWVLAVVLGCSVFGALTYGTLLASGLVAVRVAVLALTVFFLLRTATVYEFFAALAIASGTICLVAAVTGLPTLSSGRLSGGIPPLTPNEMALLASIVVLFVAWRVVLGESGWLRAGAALVALGIIWVTGSRTALLMLLVALAVMALHMRRARVGLVTGALVVAAVGSVVVITTGVLGSFIERNGTGTSTLDSRFIAWRAAATWADNVWQLVFGGGLSVKIIQVQGQWWNEQPLDSSWVSALVQTGLLGLLVCVGWGIWVLRGSLRAPHPHRVLFLGVAVFVLGRSLLESGLFDATPAFLMFFAVSLLAEGGSRARLREELRGAAVPPMLRRSRDPLPVVVPRVP
ncbi:O-antigen ligase family protein [Petropleomorpha daqingensis]|uniref:O-antigen ligase n=1 Tax=Petropleomorpha daqingensis TaxID=2026353 RepID=A0A853CEJ5_9ACTN|nr:O-antigen ligase family protein [Petropleomorpha daqingensis]NYJ06264.1 O-antigen ligase [Petropleomorpha daqingensis]